MRRKRKNLLLKELIIHIRSEENNRLKEKTQKSKEMIVHTNIVENEGKQKARKENKFQGKKKFFKKNIKNFKKLTRIDGECFVCGKYGHPASMCRQRKKKSAKVNMAKAEEKITTMVTEVNYIANTRD